MFYKKIFKPFVLCMSFFIFAQAQQPETPIYADFFKQANTLYKQNKFEDALVLYKKIPNAGAIVFYNMGNCAYKLNNYGYALAYWRNAERNWGFGGSFELLNNIKLLKNKLREDKNPEEKDKNEVFLAKIKDFKLYFDFLIRSTPIFIFQLVFLLLWILTFLIIRYLFKTKRKNLIILLFTTIAIFGLILVIKYNFEIKEHGVVISKKANLLSGPGQNYQVLTSVPEASEVTIEKAADGFFKVKINEQIGWIDQSSVEKF